MIGSCTRGVLVAQLGARRNYAVPRAFFMAGLLERFATDACINELPWRWLAGLVPWKPSTGRLRRLLDRRIPDVPASRIRGFPLFAVSAIWRNNASVSQTDYWAKRNAAFGNLVVKAGFGGADAVYGFNGAALEILRAARDRGLTTVLDQTAAPWQFIGSLLREERARWPDWEDAPGEIDDSGLLVEREEEEWTLADRIVCGSDFVTTTLTTCGGPAGRCAIVPYPLFATTPSGRSAQPRRSLAGRPLHVLFAGTLQLRKGVPYLLDAKRRLKTAQVEFRLVGPSRLSDTALLELNRQMDVVGAVPRSEMARHYAWADVLVLPTLSEGSANVCTEAMAAGLPIITTPNAGSAVRDGTNGFIVPIRDPTAIACRLERLLADIQLRDELSRNALRCAGEHGLDDYARHLAEVVGANACAL